MAPDTAEVNGREIKADSILVATGVKPLRVENKKGTFSVDAERNGERRTFSAEE